MTRRDRRRNHSLARSGLSVAQSHRSFVKPARLARTDRKSLLLGTALASTLLIAVMAAPTPAHAVVNCLVGNPAPGPISVIAPGDSITCVNTEARTNAAGSTIRLLTAGVGEFISLNNSGKLTASEYGIFSQTNASNSANTIVNSGDIAVNSISTGMGIFAQANVQDSTLTLDNSGDITVTTAANGFGIFAQTNSPGSPNNVTNSGDITVDAGDIAKGIYAVTNASLNPITLNNSGDITVSGRVAYGIHAQANGPENQLSIVNSGDISATSTDRAFGILARTTAQDNPLSIVNSGDISATSSNAYAYGIAARAYTEGSPLSLNNSGDVSAMAYGKAFGIDARTFNNGNTLSIVNSGDVTAISTNRDAYGVKARTYGSDSPLSLNNSGDVTAMAYGNAFGIDARTFSPGSTLSIVNSGTVIAISTNGHAYGIEARTFAPGDTINITNSGTIDVVSDRFSVGIRATSVSSNSGVNITNSGDIRASTSSDQYYATGIAAITRNLDAPITINNSGSVYAEGKYSVGIYAYSVSGNQTTITNTGEIGAASHLAIDVYSYGNARIYNAGTITGYVSLTDQDDLFVNQAGGTFEAKKTSFFGGGDDVFRNQNGGTVHALRDGSAAPSFEGLERFENRGTISTVDGATGDNFTISNTVGGKDLEFVAGGGSRLAVDASLGGAGSASDTFTIEGNVSGTTKVTINNTNFMGGEFNPTGIKIVTVTGATPNANAFTLDAPVDAGFFDYDLFFTPTGSGFWSLKSFPGAGAQLLPQLVTAAQDIWHQGSSTWFDRTTDLRVLVNGGAANTAYSDGATQGDGVTPAVWVRGSGSWLDRDGSGSTSANGRNYKFNLDRDLQTLDFQVGLDMGSRDLLSQGDTLVFGVLGGFVQGSLDYDNINRNFDFNGGQIGAYATYIKGGLFVDTLLNVHLMELDANGALGFPNNDLDATTVGLRTDAGYRFGSFSGGAFLEPLATLEVTWADIDGFALGGNSVKFDDDANVRGRLGLRAGTTMEAWDGTMMEPFVTGSLWGNLSGDNQATLASNGSTFRYEDNIDDVWGELSAGVNFFNFSETTSLFAKVDVTFGDDVSGVGGKAGMRVAW